MVRVYFSLMLALALAPILYGSIAVPEDLYALCALAFHEITIGLLIGFIVQLVLIAAQIAGSFLDLQVGFGLAALFSPHTIVPTTVISKFKYMLALVLFLSINGHHLMINALVSSYYAAETISLTGAFDVLLSGLWRMSLIALQIAMPVTAVTFVVDVCLGIFSRAVPQINVLLAGISGKILVGIIALSVTLPALAIGVTRGMQYAEDLILQLFRG